MGGSDNKGDGLASQPRRYRVPGQPVLNRHQVGGVSRSPYGLFAQQEREPIRGRPAMRGKRTYGGQPGQRVEEQGAWASRTQNHSEAGYGRPLDRGAWTAKTVKRPRQPHRHPQYTNYWAPLTRKRHTMPHSAQPQHTKYWAPRTRKRHQQEHRPQRPAKSSNRTQHAKGRTSDCPRPRKGTTTRRTVTQGGGGGLWHSLSGTLRGAGYSFDWLRLCSQVNNLKVLLMYLEYYYTEKYTVHCHILNMVDTVQLVKGKDKQQLLQLLRLCLCTCSPRGQLHPALMLVPPQDQCILRALMEGFWDQVDRVYGLAVEDYAQHFAIDCEALLLRDTAFTETRSTDNETVFTVPRKLTKGVGGVPEVPRVS